MNPTIFRTYIYFNKNIALFEMELPSVLFDFEQNRFQLTKME